VDSTLVLQRAKIVHALDRAVTVIGTKYSNNSKNFIQISLFSQLVGLHCYPLLNLCFEVLFFYTLRPFRIATFRLYTLPLLYFTTRSRKVKPLNFTISDKA
jgi:hypothetical protein